MKIRHRTTLTALLCGFAIPAVEAEPSVKEVHFQRADGTACHATLSIDKPSWPATIWGVDGTTPATITTGLRIRCKDHAVTIPTTAFTDLGNPLRVAVELAERGYDVIIHGAQGPLAYVARLHIENHALVERDVASLTLPGVTEHTTYP